MSERALRLAQYLEEQYDWNVFDEAPVKHCPSCHKEDLDVDYVFCPKCKTEKVEEKVEEIVEVEETKAGLATAGESTKEDSDNMLALATASLKNHIFKSTRK